jgi:hypothetical protein
MFSFNPDMKTRPNKTGGEGPLGNEIDRTPIVANEATRSPPISQSNRGAG